MCRDQFFETVEIFSMCQDQFFETVEIFSTCQSQFFETVEIVSTFRDQFLETVEIFSMCRDQFFETVEIFSTVQNNFSLYSQTCPNDHLWITATCQQWPVWSHNDQPESYLPLIFVIQSSALRPHFSGPKGGRWTQVWLYIRHGQSAARGPHAALQTFFAALECCL